MSYPDIRESARCADFPGSYWRELDETRAYPTEFVAALTVAGYLSLLIPEESGGSGLNLGAVLIAVQQDREWRSLCSRVLRRPELSDDLRFATNVARVENRAAVDAAIAKWMAGKDAREAMMLLREADIAYAQVSEVADLLRHPSLRTFEILTPAGMVRLPMPADRATGVAAKAARVPSCNEHGEALRAEFAAPMS